MPLEFVEAHNFRLFKNITIEFGEGLHLFYGENASGKTNAVAEIRKDADLIIGCDTVVVSGDDILEKPKDALDASKVYNNKTKD